MKLNIYAMIMATMALVSCNHKDLCYIDAHKSKITVVYDWRDAPEASPRGMCVFFYPVDDDNAYYRFDFSNRYGGDIEIPMGRYRLITYNNDTEIVRFSGTNHFEFHTAFTRIGDLLEPLYGNGISSTATPANGEAVWVAPDALWGCHVDEVEIDANGIKYASLPYADSRCSDCECDASDGDLIITLYPHDMLCHYSYEVRHVENAQYISKISASLSGMSPKLYMADESLDADKATIPFGGKVDADKSIVTGQFLTFGHTGDASVSHKMTFFVVMTDGSKYRIEGDENLDVTEQVDNAPDRRHVHIIIDNLKVPTPQAQDDGWKPTIDDWGIHDEELKV